MPARAVDKEFSFSLIESMNPLLLLLTLSTGAALPKLSPGNTELIHTSSANETDLFLLTLRGIADDAEDKMPEDDDRDDRDGARGSEDPEFAD